MYVYMYIFVFYNDEKLILFILQLSGAAPLPKAVSDFYAGFDIALLQVYGMSETTGISTINTPGKEIKCNVSSLTDPVQFNWVSMI